MKVKPNGSLREEDRLLDQWVSRDLSSRYDAMLSEPLPAEWLELLTTE